MAGMGGFEVLILLLLVGIPFLGLLLPPPRKHPDGGFYWGVLLLTLADCLFVGIISVIWIVEDCRRRGGLAWWHLVPPLVVLAIVLGLIANTLWARGRARQISDGIAEEDHRDAMKRLSRRLWFPLCVLYPLLSLLLVVYFVNPLTLGRICRSIWLAVSSAPPTSSSSPR